MPFYNLITSVSSAAQQLLCSVRLQLCNVSMKDTCTLMHGLYDDTKVALRHNMKTDGRHAWPVCCDMYHLVFATVLENSLP